MKSKSKKKNILLIVAMTILIMLFVGVAFLYAKGWLHKTFTAEETARSIINSTDHDYQIDFLKDGSIAFVPDQPESGFLLCPGGLVEPAAYAPLMDRLASNHVLCVMLKTNVFLQTFQNDMALDKTDLYPDIDQWYIAGHSMGGMMAVSCFDKYPEGFQGLVLLASYPTIDLSHDERVVLSIYGTNDMVMNRKGYEKSKELLPEKAKELVIEGGCHSYFADYGIKGGDGDPTISMEEQIQMTADAILDSICPE